MTEVGKIVKLLPNKLRKRLPRKVAVIRISEKESRRINRLYLGKRKPANVLSFRYAPHLWPAGKMWAKPSRRKVRGYAPDLSLRSREAKGDYGEVLLCPAVIRREAKRAGNTYKYQMTWMILHGTLHLAELHHEKSATRERFERTESWVLRKL